MSNKTEPPAPSLVPGAVSKCRVLPLFGFRSTVTPCLTAVLEDKSIKDASCDSDGAQKSAGFPLGSPKAKKKKKSPKNRT